MIKRVRLLTRYRIQGHTIMTGSELETVAGVAIDLVNRGIAEYVSSDNVVGKQERSSSKPTGNRRRSKKKATANG